MDVREYHFSRREEVETAAETGAAVQELPIGRIEETKRGPRFYFTSRLRGADRILAFALQHPALGIYNEKGEECDPHQVADEIRCMKVGTSGSGSRFGNGMSVMYNDLSAWDQEESGHPLHRGKHLLAVLLVISLGVNGVLIAYLSWASVSSNVTGIYCTEYGTRQDEQYLALLSDGSYLQLNHTMILGDGQYLMLEDGLYELQQTSGVVGHFILSDRPGTGYVLDEDGSLTFYHKVKRKPALIMQQIQAWSATIQDTHGRF